jgi:RND superfamily putative drug exporter
VGDDGAVTGPLYAIGRFCSRHPTIALWLIVAVALVIAGQASGDKTNDNLTLPGTGSTIATELLEDNLPQQAYGSNPLAFEAKSGTLTEPKRAAAIEESIERLGAMHEVNSAISPLSKEGIAAGLLSKDEKIAYTPVVLGVGPGELTEEQAEAVLDAAGPAKRAGLETSVGAYVGQQLSKPDTGVSDAIGIAAAIVILLFAFGTATAMVMPIGSAIVGLAISLSIIRLLENTIEVPSVAATLATMIGLGVGIDYALFIVTRHKLQLGEGMELRESIARATATASRWSARSASPPRSPSSPRSARRRRCCRRCSARSAPTSTRCACREPAAPTLRITSRTAGGAGREAWPPGPGARQSPRWRSSPSSRSRSSSSSSARTISAPCPSRRPPGRTTTR